MPDVNLYERLGSATPFAAVAGPSCNAVLQKSGRRSELVELGDQHLRFDEEC